MMVYDKPKLVVCTVKKIKFKSSIFFIHCYLETLQHLGHIASRVFVYCRRLCIYMLCNHRFFVMFIDFNLMNMMNNGQMDRDNENPTQHLP